MLKFSLFDAALPYAEFLSTFGGPADRDRWDQRRAAVTLTPEQVELLGKFTRVTHVMMLAGAWCGDCAAQCPILERFAEVAPALRVKYLDRDAHPEAQAELKVNGGGRVPVAVFFSEDGHEVSRFGERTLAHYRKLVQALVPGLAVAADPASQQAAVVADWLREVERVQWVLRLSPRLRGLHSD